MVLKQTGIGKKIDGVIGMCRWVMPPDVNETPGPVFLNKLYQHGKIEENIFAFRMESHADEKHQNLTSFIDIGQIKYENIRKGTKLVWLPLDVHFFWMNKKTRALRLGDDVYHYGG